MKKFENGLSIVQLEERFEMVTPIRNQQQAETVLKEATTIQYS